MKERLYHIGFIADKCDDILSIGVLAKDETQAIAHAMKEYPEDAMIGARWSQGYTIESEEIKVPKIVYTRIIGDEVHI